jgi:hypothetical protein
MDYQIAVTATKEYCCAFVYNSGIRACAQASCIAGQWWVNRVVVEPSIRRGEGIGSNLLQQLVELIRGQKGKVICVAPGGYDEDRERQFNFYRINGFSEVPYENGLMRMEFGEVS